MPADAHKRLARALTTYYVEPGKVLIRKGEVPRSVYFIASGAVEMERRGQKLRLGRGEFFWPSGNADRPNRRRAMVSAITHCTLFARG